MDPIEPTEFRRPARVTPSQAPIIAASLSGGHTLSGQPVRGTGNEVIIGGRNSWMPNRIGQHLGNYRLVRLLADGGFAEVYLGEHVHLGTQAAIKVLHAQLVSEDLEQFRQEARIVARLRHPHIVSIHDFNVENGTPFIVMDYAANGNLRQRHPRGMVVPTATILTYLHQIADALQYAHNERLIHRDIKPENMLVGWQNEILLSDFGIALVEHGSRNQMMQEIIGTLAYMAPEQLQGRPRLASDQYALGVVVYEWLCGDCPFHGSVAEIVAQHVNAPPPSLCRRNPAIAPEIEQVVFRTLSKNPEHRYPTVQDFVNAFSLVEQQHPLLLRESSGKSNITTLELHSEATVYAAPALPNWKTPLPPATGHKRKRRMSRRAVVFGLTGLTVAGLAGGISWFTWLAQQNSHAKTQTPVQHKARPTPSPTPIPTGTLMITYLSHTDAVNAVAWSPDGTYMASGSKDHTVHVWYSDSGSDAYSAYGKHTDAVNTVAWSPSTNSAGGQNLLIIASGSNDNTVQVWQVANESSPFVYSSHSAMVNSVAWSPDGTRIASGSADHTVQVWNAVDGSNTYTYPGHSDGVKAVVWSPDGTHIASGSVDTSVQVWNAIDGSNAFIYKGHTDVVNAVAWSPDGSKVASGSNDKTVQVWNSTTDTQIISYQGHTDAVNAVAWSPAGSTIASASNDGTVHIWNASDGAQIFVYSHHTAAVLTVAWSPNGTLLASGSADNTVQIWRA